MKHTTVTHIRSYIAELLIIALLFTPLGETVIRVFDRHVGSVLERTIGPQEVDAAWEFEARGMTAVTALNTSGNEVNVRQSDGDYTRLLTSENGLDVQFRFDDVKLWNANRIIILYDGLASSATLAYTIEIYDTVARTWRNIIPHKDTYTNTAEQTTAAYTLAPATTGALSGGFFELYNGYFSQSATDHVDTPLANFVNSDGQILVRFYSTVTTPDLELDVDLLTVRVANSPTYYASSATNNTAGSIDLGGYADTITDDGVTNPPAFMRAQAAASGTDRISLDFNFDEVTMPYTDANAFLVEFSGLASASAALKIQMLRNDGTPRTLNPSADITSASDGGYYFSFDPTTVGDTMADYISTAVPKNRLRIRVYSTATSGSATIDYLRVTIGSIVRNDAGDYPVTLLRGSTAAGSADSIKTLETTDTTPDTWDITTAAGYTAGQYPGDCSVDTNQCNSAIAAFPITVPDNSVVTSLVTAIRFRTTSNALDNTFSLVDSNRNYIDMAGTNDRGTTQTMTISEVAPLTKPPIGDAGALIANTYTPQRYYDANKHTVNLRLRSTGADSTSRATYWDYAFVSVKTIKPTPGIQYRYTATSATLGAGMGETTSNFHYTNSDDNVRWVTTQTSGTDATLVFGGITIPEGANSLLITSKQLFSVNSQPYKMQLYDTVSGIWRDLNPHAWNGTTTFTSSNSLVYTQLSIFDGYFSADATTATSTPLTNFVSADAAKELKLKIVAVTGTGALNWDFCQIQFLTDPQYFSSGVTLADSKGSVSSNRYVDTFTDDNGIGKNFVLSPGAGNEIDARFRFSTVRVPPEGFNTVLFQVSAWKTTAGTYGMDMYNVRTGNWEAITSGVTRTADAIDYFSFSVGDWHDYISSDASSAIQVRLTSSGNANALNIDYLTMTMGMAPGPNTKSAVRTGALIGASLGGWGNIDTYNNTNELDLSKFTILTPTHTLSGMSATSEFSGVASSVDLPFKLDQSVVPGGFFWFLRSASPTSSTPRLNVSFADPGGHYRILNSSYYYPLINMMGPTGAPQVYIASATQAIAQGWYIDQIEDLWVMKWQTLPMRIYTTVGVSVAGDIRYNVDFIFFSYRWVAAPATPILDKQMRHGKWWFEGNEQNFEF